MIGAFSIILDDENRVLLCKRRDKDLWNLPGGRVEQDESPWAAAVREAQEEMNVVITIERLGFISSRARRNCLSVSR